MNNGKNSFVLFERGKDGRFSKEISLKNLFPEAAKLQNEILFMQGKLAHAEMKYHDGLNASIQYYLFGIDWDSSSESVCEIQNIIALGSEILKALGATRHDLAFNNIDLVCSKNSIEAYCAVYDLLCKKNEERHILTEFQLKMISNEIWQCICAYNQNIKGRIALIQQNNFMMCCSVQNPFQFSAATSQICVNNYTIQQLNELRIEKEEKDMATM